MIIITQTHHAIFPFNSNHFCLNMQCLCVGMSNNFLIVLKMRLCILAASGHSAAAPQITQAALFQCYLAMVV